MQQHNRTINRMPSYQTGDSNWGQAWRTMLEDPRLQEWERAWTNAYDLWNQTMQAAWAPLLQPANQPHRRDCTCHDCRRQGCKPDCQCQCCIVDADLLVYARVGERHIVPVVIENNRRRERTIELQLSDWSHPKEQPVDVVAQIMAPTHFTLAACAEQAVILAIDVKPNAGSTDKPRNELTDVDQCTVCYADLRVKGCDLRAIRVAVAILPRDCDEYVVDCGCGCC